MKNILFALLLSTVFAGCAGYVPGRQSYWDAQVKEMCEKDGGVIIFERVQITRDQFQNMQKIGGHISIPPRLSATMNDILVWEESVTILRDANPRVWRSEQLVKRIDGEKVVARVVRYSRVGGDMPSPAHSSSFGCPDERDVLAQREKIFVINGEAK